MYSHKIIERENEYGEIVERFAIKYRVVIDGRDEFGRWEGSVEEILRDGKPYEGLTRDEEDQLFWDEVHRDD